MDGVPITRSCTGYYWHYTFSTGGPYAEGSGTTLFMRAPAVVYTPTVPNPVLTFNYECPSPNPNGVSIRPPNLAGVSLVPRCQCQEYSSNAIAHPSSNFAFNGNFADTDLQQENPVVGWTSVESWRAMVIPMHYTGPAVSQDKSNNVSV